MPCEMCGRDVPRLRRVLIGGTELEVCSECARFGSDMAREVPAGEPVASGPAATAAPRTVRPATRRPRDALSGGEEELVEDYHARIRNGRSKMGLSQEDLAKRINEKKSVISRLETGEMRPSDKLVKTLERVLEIKLKERVELQMDDQAAKKRRAASGGVTLGDLIKMGK